MWKFGQFTSKVFSVLLQPFFMPLYSVALLLVYTNFFGIYRGQLFNFLLPIFIFSTFLPSLFIFILWKLRYIKEVNLPSRSERTLPYIIFITSNVSLTYFFYTSGVYIWFLGLVGAPAVIALAALIINFFWKISAHALGIGGLIGGVLSVSMNVSVGNPVLLFIILFMLAGCLGVSRLYLRKSTPAQIYAGFIIGLVLAYLSVFACVYTVSISF
jgi:membrane-associated phospholipid phosphatase